MAAVAHWENLSPKQKGTIRELERAQQAHSSGMAAERGAPRHHVDAADRRPPGARRLALLCIRDPSLEPFVRLARRSVTTGHP